MNFCPDCGASIEAGALFCPKCGRKLTTEEAVTPEVVNKPEDEGTLVLLAKIFMVISIVISGIAIIPLCWTIPMTVHYFKSIKEHEPVSIAFKICTLLFINVIPGVLMLVDEKH